MKEEKKSFAPVIAEGCRVLILGSLPGDESLKQIQYYAHPRNAFWKIMASLLGFDVNLPYRDRLQCLLNNKLALWDVVEKASRYGSLDQHIKEETPNSIDDLLEYYPHIELILCNGTTSFRLLKKHFPTLFCREHLHIRQMPSTSPAAARIRYEEKMEGYKEALMPYLSDWFRHGMNADEKKRSEMV